jgi:hypothetical protein
MQLTGHAAAGPLSRCSRRKKLVHKNLPCRDKVSKK